MTLWVGTSAADIEFSASLSRQDAGGTWGSLCGATGNTLSREGSEPLPLPGKGAAAQNLQMYMIHRPCQLPKRCCQQLNRGTM